MKIFSSNPVTIVIKDKKAAQSLIKENSETLDFTCVFRAYIYAEIHLNEYEKIKKSENISKEILKKNIDNEMPEDILLETFLGLQMNNWVDASVFSKLCRNVHENFINSDILKIPPYKNKQIENYEIYGSIFNINKLFLNGSIAGAGAGPERKISASNHTKRPIFNDDEKTNRYYSDIFEQQSKIDKKLTNIFQNDQFAANHAWLISDHDTPRMIKRIEQFYQAKNDAISFVIISDSSKTSATLHAFAITVTKINNEISCFIVSEDANKADYTEEIKYIQNVMNDYKKIGKLHKTYQDALYMVNKNSQILCSYGLNAMFLIFLCWHILPEQYKIQIKTTILKIRN